MEDDEFNFYRIVTSLVIVAQLALQDSFETLWNRKYPETPWAKNAASVKLFEEKEDVHFQNSLQGLSNAEKGRKTKKRNRLQSTFKDDGWRAYDWDISKFAYALVDSKIFKLDETDMSGIPISGHIVQIKEIRNTIAHFTKMYCDTDYFENTLNSMEGHVKAFELVKVNVSSYIAELQKIRTDEKPVSNKECYEMRTMFEKLKSSQQIYEERWKSSQQIYEEREKSSQQFYEEREKIYKLLEQQSEEREKHSNEKIALLEHRHSTELERLRYDHELVKQQHSVEVERLQSKYALSKKTHLHENTILKQRINTLESIIYLRKPKHSENEEELQSETQLLEHGNSREFKKLKSAELGLDNRVNKSTIQTRCKINGIMKAVFVIIIVWHHVKGNRENSCTRSSENDN